MSKIKIITIEIPYRTKVCELINTLEDIKEIDVNAEVVALDNYDGISFEVNKEKEQENG